MANQTSSESAAQVAALFADADPAQVAALAERYADDPRKQVQSARSRALRRSERAEAERGRVLGMYRLMDELSGGLVAVGVDEVGRGSVAGPLTVAAVRLPDEPVVWGVNDSKQLSAARREVLKVRIEEVALGVGIAHVPPSRIDEAGMAQCLREAVRAAVADTGLDVERILMDGNPLHADPREVCVVHGDAQVASIAAASIVAKVTRDELMRELDAEYPGYHLAESKGYASPAHIAAIRELGLSPAHRASFCGNFLETPRLF